MTNRKTKRCAAQHFGAWACEPKWLKQALAEVRAGTWQPEKREEDDDGEAYTRAGSVAVISIADQITKGASSFGGTSSVRVRQSIRAAVQDDAIASILLHIDSPGGTVAGTGDLADEVAAARNTKPVFAYIEDLGASAAYWIASQAERVYANPTALIGSIGTYAVLEDSTGAMEAQGVKLTVVSTGKYKGLGADGKVTDTLVEDVRREVESLNESFLEAVMAGRKLSREKMTAIADGRVWIAKDAQELGLIDEVASLDAAIGAIVNGVRNMNREAFDAFAAENPEAVATYVDQGYKAGHAQGTTDERARITAVLDAAGNRVAVARDAIGKGQYAEDVKLLVEALDAEAKTHAAELAAKDAEIAALKAAAGTQAPVNTAGAAKVEPASDGLTVEERAGLEWDRDDVIRAKHKSRKGYIAYQKAVADGRIKVLAKMPADPKE